MRLKLYRPTPSPFEFVTVGESSFESITPAVLNSFPTRVTAQGGDVLGFSVGAGSNGCVFNSGDGGDVYQGTLGDPPVGSTATLIGPTGGLRLNVSAVLEPDSDGDGFGDETQDKCVGTAGAFNGCPSSVTLDKVKQKGTKPKVKVTATVPGAGTLRAGSPSDPALATAAAKSLKPVTRTLTSTAKQTLVLTLKLTRSARRKLSDEGKLKTKVKVAYTPAGGPAAAARGKAKLRS